MNISKWDGPLRRISGTLQAEPGDHTESILMNKFTCFKPASFPPAIAAFLWRFPERQATHFHFLQYPSVCVWWKKGQETFPCSAASTPDSNRIPWGLVKSADSWVLPSLEIQVPKVCCPRATQLVPRRHQVCPQSSGPLAGLPGWRGRSFPQSSP